MLTLLRVINHLKPSGNLYVPHYLTPKQRVHAFRMIPRKEKQRLQYFLTALIG